jgi:lipopolysaccharide export system permease protein
MFYVGKHFLKNLLVILFGFGFAFAAIDYFQNMQGEDISGNLKILYLFYKWQEALGLLYPLSLIFALIVTKFSLVKSNTMVVLHAFGYSARRLFIPPLLLSIVVYGVFMYLHTTEFSNAQNRAKQLLKNQVDGYSVNDIFVKYNDVFVYIKRLDPIRNSLQEMTLFKVVNSRVEHTIEAPEAKFDGTHWHAVNAKIKTHLYDGTNLKGFHVEQKKVLQTLKGYKPKIMESFNEGKSLNIVDTYRAMKLFNEQGINSDKMRALLYTKVVTPLFLFALLVLFFFKLPYHARMVHLGVVIVISLGIALVTWGVLFGLGEIAKNGVILPEFASILPIALLLGYALFIYFKSEKLD